MEPRNTYAGTLTLKTFVIFAVGTAVVIILVLLFSSKRFPSTSNGFQSEPDSSMQEKPQQSSVDEFNTIEPVIPEPAITSSKKNTNRDEVVEVTIEINDSVIDESPVPVPVPRPISEEDKIFTDVEKNAVPVGGMSAFNDFIDRKLKYPVQATRMKVEGFVFVEFVVERDGSLREVKSVKGIGTGCDEEAVRLVSSAPPWKPARHNGKIVRQKIMVAIPFDLDNRKRKK